MICPRTQAPQRSLKRKPVGDMIPADPGPFMSMQRHSTALNGIIFKPSQESQLRSARGGFHVDSKTVIISYYFYLVWT
jgi:hypothetical protein